MGYSLEWNVVEQILMLTATTFCWDTVWFAALSGMRRETLFFKNRGWSDFDITIIQDSLVHLAREMLQDNCKICKKEAISHNGEYKILHTSLCQYHTQYLTYAEHERCTMNIHTLSHLAACVRSWGPVWCYSCYPLESRNADIKLIFNGSRDMSKQVCGENGNMLLCILNVRDGIFLCVDPIQEVLKNTLMLLFNIYKMYSWAVRANSHLCLKSHFLLI